MTVGQICVIFWSISFVCSILWAVWIRKRMDDDMKDKYLCGFDELKECNNSCEHFDTCTRNPINRAGRVHTKECLSCNKFFKCKGKPKEMERCLYYEPKQ